MHVWSYLQSVLHFFIIPMLVGKFKKNNNIVNYPSKNHENFEQSSNRSADKNFVNFLWLLNFQILQIFEYKVSPLDWKNLLFHEMLISTFLWVIYWI